MSVSRSRGAIPAVIDVEDRQIPWPAHPAIVSVAEFTRARWNACSVSRLGVADSTLSQAGARVRRQRKRRTCSEGRSGADLRTADGGNTRRRRTNADVLQVCCANPSFPARGRPSRHPKTSTSPKSGSRWPVNDGLRYSSTAKILIGTIRHFWQRVAQKQGDPDGWPLRKSKKKIATRKRDARLQRRSGGRLGTRALTECGARRCSQKKEAALAATGAIEPTKRPE